MPDPREAVYDVLLAKKRRAEDEAAVAEVWRAFQEEQYAFATKIGRVTLDADSSRTRFRHLHSV